ncbi:hypothetical protein FQA39_LY13717 [Lamprigera yunnana]|nr:hypothetical protein FQA39_LY13717 [Lamprigera yunnana]
MDREITLQDIMNQLIVIENKMDETKTDAKQQAEKIEKLEEITQQQELKVEILENEIRRRNIINFGIAKEDKEDTKTIKEICRENLAGLKGTKIGVSEDMDKNTREEKTDTVHEQSQEKRK